MSTVTRKFIVKELAAGELSESLKFTVSRFLADPEAAKFKIMRELSDGATEIRDDLTYIDLASICNLKRDFHFLSLRFKDSSKTDIEVEFSTIGLHDDVFTVTIRSKNEENIQSFFDLLIAKLKLENAKSVSLFKEALSSPTKDELASRPYEYKHALLIKPDDIKYLEQFLSSNFEVVEYIARCVDGTKIPFFSIEEILDYENPSFKRITSLEIEARSRKASNTYLDLKIGVVSSFIFDSTAQFMLMYKDLNWGIKIEQELIDRIKGLRPWYWWLKKVSFAIILPSIPFLASMWINSISLIQKLRGTYVPRPKPSAYEFNSNEGFIFAVMVAIVLIAIGAGLDRIINYLFPKVFFCFGKQAAEFSRRQKITSWIFGGIIFAIILGITINWLTLLIFGQ